MCVKRSVLPGVIVAALTLGSLPAAAAVCDADLSIGLARKDEDQGKIEYVYKIDVTVRSNCAVVEFNILLEVEEPGGETKTVKKPRRVKLRNGSTTEGYRYSTSSANKILSAKIEEVGCQTCE